MAPEHDQTVCIRGNGCVSDAQLFPLIRIGIGIQRAGQLGTKTVVPAKQPDRAVAGELLELGIEDNVDLPRLAMLPGLGQRPVGLQLRGLGRGRQHHQHAFSSEHLADGGGDLCPMQAPEYIELGVDIEP